MPFCTRKVTVSAVLNGGMIDGWVDPMDNSERSGADWPPDGWGGIDNTLCPEHEQERVAALGDVEGFA